MHRLDNLKSHAFLSSKGTLRFARINIIEYEAFMTLFHEKSFDRINHLAAQARFRHSIGRPMIYAEANLYVFLLYYKYALNLQAFYP
ncbi:GDP-mannose 4,6-dehydratase [Paraglaciecola sp. 2405UD69-4]|uniref:GDP-mannose 4,6-dehydratase n=1 Tax=Paraglaciecola sp. 2405UD69-4 TaxID=3391836 RepID=UPI0039C9C55A